jgi:hypothetical protein
MYEKKQHNPSPKNFLIILAFVVALFAIPIPSRADSSITNLTVPILGTMVPQGICFVENYVIFTGYDSEKETSSVLWVKDIVTDSIVATVDLQTKDHVGGICYDGTYLWISSSKNKVRYIKYSDIENQIKQGYQFFSLSTAVEEREINCVQVPINIESGSLITGTSRVASSLTYYDGFLYVAEFDGKSVSNPNPKLTKLQVIFENNKPKALHFVNVFQLPDRVQGVAICKKGKITYVILSCSEGKEKRSLSCIRVFNLDTLRNALAYPTKTRDFSKKNEFLMIEGIAIKANTNYLYAISESAASIYKKKSPSPRSDVLPISLNDLLN